MNDDINDSIEAAFKGAAEGAAKGLAEKIPPIYDDVVRKSAIQIGDFFGTIIKIPNILISPVEWIDKYLKTKIENIDKTNVITPPANLLMPILDYCKYLPDDDDLSELFAQLIATSMTNEISKLAHPSFVEILKNMRREDCLVLKKLYLTDEPIPIIEPEAGAWQSAKYRFFLSGFKNDLELKYNVDVTLALINLHRLGLFDMISAVKGQADFWFEPIYYDDRNSEYFDKNVPFNDGIIGSGLYFLRITMFGESLCKACIKG